MSSRYAVTVTGPEDRNLEFNWPSVTEIIDAVLAKPGLHDWYYKEGVRGFSYLLQKYGDGTPNDVKSLHSLMKTEGLSPYAQRDNAAGEGRKIHEAVEKLANGKKVEGYEALKDWWYGRWGRKRSQILAAEQVVASFKNQYCGTLDLVYTENSGTVLSDVKSGAVRESHAVQLELYRWAWEECFGVKIDAMTVIQVARDGGGVVEHEIAMTDKLTEAASGILQVYRWSKLR